MPCEIDDCGWYDDRVHVGDMNAMCRAANLRVIHVAVVHPKRWGELWPAPYNNIEDFVHVMMMITTRNHGLTKKQIISEVTKDFFHYSICEVS